MTNNKFKESEIPYSTFERFGLSSEMLSDLPEDVMKDILNGRKSPVLPVRITGDDGRVVHSRTRFILFRQDENTVDVLFYPELQTATLDRFSRENQERLSAKRVITDNYVRENGEEITAFMQLDGETNQVMIVPTEVLGRNLDFLQREYKFSNAELTCLRNGERLTILDHEEEVTMGIDLKTRTGLRFCMGDVQKWQQQESPRYDRYNFGIYGCWHIDDDSNWIYTREEDYDEELWNELKKKGQHQQEQHARLMR